MGNQKEYGQSDLEISPLEPHNVANDRNCEELKVCSFSQIPKEIPSLFCVKYPVELNCSHSDSLCALGSGQFVQISLLFLKLFVNDNMVELAV